MATDETSQAKKTFRVWADDVRRVFQEIEADSQQHAHRLAQERRDDWEPCDEHDGDSYRLSGEVQNLATGEFARIDGATHCRTCGSEIVETINESCFRDGECGPCEYRRYQSQADLLAAARAGYRALRELAWQQGLAGDAPEFDEHGRGHAAMTALKSAIDRANANAS